MTEFAGKVAVVTAGTTGIGKGCALRLAEGGGAEYFIAQFFPWDKYRINLLTVERPTPPLQELLKGAGMVYLLDHGGFGDMLYCHRSKEAEFKAKLKWAPPKKTRHNAWAMDNQGYWAA